MDKLISFTSKMSEFTGKFVSYAIYIGIAMLSCEVVLRYVFNHPTVWAHGYTQRLFASYYILIGAFTLIKGGHVRVDLIYNLVSRKGKIVLDMLNYLCLLIWGSSLLYSGWLYFLTSWHEHEVDETVLRAPIYPIKFLLVVGVFLITWQGLVNFIETLVSLLKGEE